MNNFIIEFETAKTTITHYIRLDCHTNHIFQTFMDYLTQLDITSARLYYKDTLVTSSKTEIIQLAIDMAQLKVIVNHVKTTAYMGSYIVNDCLNKTIHDCIGSMRMEFVAPDGQVFNNVLPTFENGTAVQKFFDDSKRVCQYLYVLMCKDLVEMSLSQSYDRPARQYSRVPKEYAVPNDVKESIGKILTESHPAGKIMTESKPKTVVIGYKVLEELEKAQASTNMDEIKKILSVMHYMLKK